MIEQARESLEQFLKYNLEHLKKSEEYNKERKLTVLRQAWASIYPEYKEYDIDLDVLWEGLSGASSSMTSWNGWCGCCGEGPGVPTAKSFRVVVRDWNDEIVIHNRITVYLDKMSSMQKELQQMKSARNS